MENLISAFEFIETVLVYYCSRHPVIYWELKTDAEENV
jgi:hypothetical protein